MKILQAKVQWFQGYGNNPVMQVLVDKIPNRKDLRYKQKGGLYYAELEGFVHFLYKKGQHQEKGFGGYAWPITLSSGEKKILKGPWSSRAGVANQLGFGPCADVSITDSPTAFKRGYTFIAGSITLNKLVDATRLAQCYLVKKYIINNSQRWFHLSDPQSCIADYCGEVVCDFETEIPQGVEYIVVPSKSPSKLIKSE